VRPYLTASARLGPRALPLPVATGLRKLLQNCWLCRNRSTMRQPSLVSHPHPRPSPRGRVALGEPLYEFSLPPGEGQGEGQSWHDCSLTKNFATVSPCRSNWVPKSEIVLAKKRQGRTHGSAPTTPVDAARDYITISKRRATRQSPLPNRPMS